MSVLRSPAARAALAVGWFGVVASGAGLAIAQDAPVDAGEVVIVDPADPSREITEGESSTVFTLRLPVGASCPGDSANDDWRVQSFLIPVADDPATLEFGGVRPRGEGQNALYAVDTAPFVNVLTAQNERPGEPGQILGVPALSFAVYPAGYLPPGDYLLGIACTQIPATTQKYWDTSIVIEDAPDVEPGELRWKVRPPADTGDSAATGSGGGSPWLLAIGVAVAIAAAVVLVRRRPRRRPTQLAKEHR